MSEWGVRRCDLSVFLCPRACPAGVQAGNHEFSRLIKQHDPRLSQFLSDDPIVDQAAAYCRSIQIRSPAFQRYVYSWCLLMNEVWKELPRRSESQQDLRVSDPFLRHLTLTSLRRELNWISNQSNGNGLPRTSNVRRIHTEPRMPPAIKMCAS